MTDKLSRHELAEVVANLLEKNSSQRTAKSLAAYLLEQNRVGELDSLLRDLKQHRAEQGGVVELNAISAFKLSEQVKQDIQAQIKQLYPGVRQIIINERLDETVVSGVRLELANQQLDLTSRSKLNQFIQLTSKLK